MLTIFLAPIIAFTIDYLKRRIKFSNRIVFSAFIVLLIPIFVTWISGFEFSSMVLHWTVVTIILTFCCFTFFTILSVNQKVKLVLAIILTIPMLFIAYMGAIGGEFGGGKRQVLKKSTYLNYVAYELGPKMYERNNTLLIKKMMFSNLIEKTIYETTFTATSVNWNCNEYVSETKPALKYDLCNHTLSSR
jgi:hypothetical protein